MRTLTIFILFALSALFVSAQPSLKDVAISGPYVSEKSGFTIALPKEPTSVSTVNNAGTKPGAVGTRYRWLLREGEIVVMHNVYNDPILANIQEIHDYTKLIKDRIIAQHDNARFVKESQTGALSWSGPSYEFVVAGKLMFSQAYVRGNEEFILTATADPKVMASEPMIRTAVGSFQPTKGWVVINGVTYAVPPSVTDPYTLLSMHKDIREEYLKGRVKSVIVEEETKYQWRTIPRWKSSERQYDSFGNAVRSFAYPQRGTFTRETVFTNDYLTNKRTSDDTFTYPTAEGKYSPFAPLKKEYRYLHDDKGRTIEEMVLDNKGVQTSGTKYEYKDDGTVTIRPFGGGWRERLTFDEKGNVIKKELIIYFGDLFSEPFTYTYKYEAFDAEGNWTKRTITEDSETITEWRTITYWK